MPLLSVNDIYSITNDLAQTAMGGAVTVTDPTSFADFGKAVAGLSGLNLKNSIVPALVQTITKQIHNVNEYNPVMIPMYTDTSDMGIIEILSQHFYDAVACHTWNITNGYNASDDMNTYVTNPQSANYYWTNDTYKFKLSTTTNALKEAFVSDTGMANWLSAKTREVANSHALRRQELRRRLFTEAIADAYYKVVVTPDQSRADLHPATTEDEITTIYNCVTIYNTKYQLSGDNAVPTGVTALNNVDFCKWLSGFIPYIKAKMYEPSERWYTGLLSSTGADNPKAFTTPSACHIVVPKKVETAMRLARLTIPNDNTGDVTTEGYTTINYFNNPQEPLAVYRSKGNATTKMADVVAVLYDEMTFAELSVAEKTTSHYVASDDFTNTWFHFAMRYIYNQYAPLVQLTLN